MMRSVLLTLALASNVSAEHSSSYSMEYTSFKCFIDECGCPGSFAKTWCSESTGLITSTWCNESPENCEHCTGSVCYDGEENSEPPATADDMECYINQCGCPGSFAETWCSETTAKITSPWCGESAENCAMCSGSYCGTDESTPAPAPTGECFINQCGCPGSYGQTWCTDSIAKITSEWCNMNEANCGNCAGAFCETTAPYECPTGAGAVVFAAYPGYTGDKVVTGCVLVAETETGITITGVVSGLAADGTGGLHIHSGMSCATTEGPGGHYFEGMSDDPWTTNYVSDASGSATIDFALNDFSMHGDYPVAMRTVVVHDVGGGERIACGIISE